MLFIMKKILIFALLLTSCSTSSLQENSNSKVENRVDSNHKEDANDFKVTNTFNYSPTWKIGSDDEYGRLATVSAMGKTKDGEVQTSFTLQCPAKKNPLAGIKYYIDQDKAIHFNFEDFEGPNAAASNKEALEIRASSPQRKLSFRTNVWGNVGLFGVSDKQDKIIQLAQMVAKGGTEVTLIIHDSPDYQNTIETKFPAIEPSSDVAKILNGCRK